MNETERAALVEERTNVIRSIIASAMKWAANNPHKRPDSAAFKDVLSQTATDAYRAATYFDECTCDFCNDRAVPEPGADAIYRERNQVVAALSKCFYSWIGTVDDAEPGWTKAVYIDLPSGQASWHIPDHEIPDLFGHLQESGEPWDGHTTEEKYERLAALDAIGLGEQEAER